LKHRKNPRIRKIKKKTKMGRDKIEDDMRKRHDPDLSEDAWNKRWKDAKDVKQAAREKDREKLMKRLDKDGKLEHDGEEISTGEASSSERKRKRKKSEEGEISDDGDDVNPKDMVIYSF